MNEEVQLDAWRNHININPESIIIFGSYARNDYNEDSDIDMLLIHPEYHPAIQIGKLSVSIYSTNKLIEFARNGSLFILHLIKEGKVLEGHDILETLENEFKMPNFKNLENELLESCKLLLVSEEEFENYSVNIIGVQKFILRSIVYMRGIERGAETFNIMKVLAILDLEKIGYIFDRKFQKNMNYHQFQEINVILEKLLKIRFEKNIYSIEATILNNYPKMNLLHSLGMSIIKKDSTGIDYPKLIFNGIR